MIGRANWHRGTALALLLMAAACGGGGSGPSGTFSNPTPTPSASTTGAPVATPTPTASATPTPSAGANTTPFPTPSPTSSSWAANAAAQFSSAPDVPGCTAGTLNQAVITDALQTLNAIRALHHLPAVTFSATDENAAQQAALMMAANGALNHNPPTTWKCYTAAGAAGAGSSDLYGGTISPYLVWSTTQDYFAGWMTETSNIVANNVGHRRWILDPCLGTVAYGRVSQVLSDGSRTDAAALKVFNNTGSNSYSGTLPPYVAYPYGDYPAKYFDPSALFSFSAIIDTTNLANNANVDFSKATVAVTSGTTALTVSNISYDNQGYGLPNNIQFAVAGVQSGVSYTVAINGVLVRGTSTNYSYTFRIVS
jgi:uncharacterized protein YkwD